jgi:glutamate racemase
MLGVYDSGLGGITVLKEILNLYPDTDIVYLADTAHCPLGEKTPQEITKIVTNGIEFLFAQGCDLVILACNTATAISIRQIQNQWLPAHFPHKKVLGIIRPTTELLSENEQYPTPKQALETKLTVSDPAASNGVLHNNKVEHSDKIAIFATPATVQSGFYKQELLDFGYTNTLQIAFSGLASAIENQDITQCRKIIQTQLQLHISDLFELKYIVLACTHYPIITDIFRQELDKLIPTNQTQILDQAKITAKKLVEYTQKNPQYKLSPGKLQIYSTADQDDFQLKINSIFGLNNNVKLYHI